MQREFDELFKRYPALQAMEEALTAAADRMERSLLSGGKLLLCGNGGSCADAQHMVGELMKGFLLPRALTAAQKQAFKKDGAQRGEKLAQCLQQGLPALDLAAHTALNTAFANDCAPELCFAQQAFVLAKEHDVFFGISTSGNAENVLYAGAAARAKGACLIGLTGQNKCAMDGAFDLVLHVPAGRTFEIQELHLPVYHALCAVLERRFFGGEAADE